MMIESLLTVRLHFARLLSKLGRREIAALTYREFRSRRIAHLSGTLGGAQGKDGVRGLAQGRATIANFRKHIEIGELRSVRTSIAAPQHVARALRIPEFIPVFPSWPFKLAVMIATDAMSERNKVAVVARLLGMIRTPEGKEHAYSNLLYLVCGQRDTNRSPCKYYSDEMAYLLAEFDGFDSPKELHALASLPMPLLRAGKRLGLSSPARMLEELHPLRNGVSPEAILILAEEGVLTSGFAPVRPYVKTDGHHHYDVLIQGEAFRKTVQILLRAGVAPHLVLAVLHQTQQLAPRELEVSLSLLAEHGVSDVSSIYEAIGQVLWTLNRDVLRYLLADVGIRDGAVLAAMEQLLRQQLPAPEVVEALLEHVSPAELTEVQTFLIGTSNDHPQAALRIRCLLGAPHHLSCAELNQCTPYATNDGSSNEKFLSFLDVLVRHGLGNSRGVLQFQKCFSAARSAEAVEKYIVLARKHVADISDDCLASFVEQALAVSSISLLYLLDTSGVAIVGKKDLDKMIRLAAVSPNVLRYLVCERELKTAASLGRWFYEEAEGVQDYYGGEDYGDLERILFADCSRRKAFFRLHQNIKCVLDAMWRYSTARLPPMDMLWGEEQRASYWAQSAQYRAEARVKAVPFLRPILERTEGIVLANVLEAAIEGRDLNWALDALEPMLGSLWKGRGPAGAVLSPMEAEAIGLVYGVTTQQVESHWHEVQGCERHLDGVQLDDSYAMSWSKKRYSLPDFTPAHAQALLSNMGALATAAARARQLHAAEDAEMVITQFNPKTLTNDAAAAPELADWLALLLYICGSEPAVRSWVDHTLESYTDFLDRPDEAHTRILALQTFMDTTLPDELAGCVNKFAADLLAPAAGDLADLLGPLANGQSGARADSTDRDHLAAALRGLSSKVLVVFNKWIASLQQKFKSEKKNFPDVMHVSAIVTKYPAAFYARYKFGLCTRANTDMWREKRHSHMVVFDNERKSLVGIAMVYFQPIERNFGGERCMVVRAINIRSSNDIEVDAATAIDEIMRIAVDIARRNGMAAVLFPRASTYFSNQSFVEKAASSAVSTRKAPSIALNRPSFDHSQSAGTLFWCKAQGERDGAVSELFTVWTATSDTAAKQTGEILQAVK